MFEREADRGWPPGPRAKSWPGSLLASRFASSVVTFPMKGFRLPSMLIFAAGAAVLACAGLLAGCSAEPDDRPGVYALALHVHGSLSEGPASMAAHDAASRAMAQPVDVIWWTDHSWRIRGHTYFDRFDFEQGLTSEVEVPHALSRLERDRIDEEAAGVASPLELAWLGIEPNELARVT